LETGTSDGMAVGARETSMSNYTDCLKDGLTSGVTTVRSWFGGPSTIKQNNRGGIQVGGGGGEQEMYALLEEDL
jgi:hypothetical protein